MKEADMRLAIVIRGSDVLALPKGRGPLPTCEELDGIMTVVESTEYDGNLVVTSVAGSTPDGWRWVPVAELQAEAPELSDIIGEALLCA